MIRVSPLPAALPAWASPIYPNGPYYDTSWSNAIVAARYAAYSFFVDNQATEPPNNPGNPNINASSVTNLPGRIHIYSGNLNLLNTRLRGEGEVVMNATHLANSLNASVNCQNLSYNLGSTNGYLNVINLTDTNVPRFNGTVSLWSAVWSNTTTTVYLDNWWASNDVPPTYYPRPLTNAVQINVYALFVDASHLTSSVPVTVYDMQLHSTNIVISDSMNVIQSFLLDGRSFTLNGSLNFQGLSPINPVAQTPFVAMPIKNWVYTMAPTLRYFTNNGSLVITNDAHFGDDGPTNYLVFVNNGTITANAQTIESGFLEINGGTDISLRGDFTATAGTAILTNATIIATGDINITAGSLQIDPSTLSANYTLNFAVTTNLSDLGTGSGSSLNTFSCQNGFNLWVKPQTGDLLGTAFTSEVWNDAEVDHFWAGADLGANAARLANNAAIFSLVLSPQDYSSPYYPLFFFSGTGAHNGLYVGTLDLSQLGSSAADITNMLAIDPSLNIYYSHAKLSFTPPGSPNTGSLFEWQTISCGRRPFVSVERLRDQSRQPQDSSQPKSDGQTRQRRPPIDGERLSFRAKL